MARAKQKFAGCVCTECGCAYTPTSGRQIRCNKCRDEFGLYKESKRTRMRIGSDDFDHDIDDISWG